MKKQILKVFFIATVFFWLPNFAEAYGAPDYIPDAAHPRIFITSSVLSSLQAKAATNDQDWLDLKARADVLITYSVSVYDRTATPVNSINYSYEGMGWLEAAQVLGLAYKVTGTTAYAAKLKELIDVINAAGSTPVVAVDSGFPTRSVCFAMALMYDWLYDYLDSSTKSAMIMTINSYYNSYIDGTGWYGILGPAYDNYFVGHLLGFGTCAIATYGDNATAPAMLSDMRTKWNNTMPAAFTSGGYAGGYPVESYNYGPNNVIRALQYGIALQTASGEDIYSTYASKMVKNLFYNLKPNRWQSTDEGDMPGTYSGIMPSNLSIVLSGFVPGTDGDHMAYFYDHLANTPYADATNTVQKADPFTRFLFKIPRAQADYRLTEPLSFRSVGDEHFYVRSDWSDNAVWASYMGGNIQWAAHQSNSAGHVAIQRGNDYLLVNSGQWKGTDGIVGSPYNFNTASQWHNTLYFTDGPATQPWTYLYYGGQTGLYAGGQMQGFSDTNSILNYETINNYTYVKADHTNAYDIRVDSRDPVKRSVQYFYRNFIYLNPGTFVVYDRIKAYSSTYTKKLYWHLNKQGQPIMIDNRTTSSTVGSSKLVIKSVYPTTSTVVFAQDISDSSGDTTPRVEISDSVVSTDFNPLTVLIADSNTATMPTTTSIDTTGMLGVLIDETIPKIVIFSKDGTSQNTVTYIAPYPLSDTGNHLIVDMEPGSYDVYRDDTKILSDVVASAQGVLSFSAIGGTQFQIVANASDMTAPSAPNGLDVQ